MPQPTPHVVMIGTPVDGFYVVGPFESRDLAQGYVDSEFNRSNMWVMELQAPAEEESD